MKIYIPETGSTYEGTPEALAAFAASIYHTPHYKYMHKRSIYDQLPWPFNVEWPGMMAPIGGG